MPKNIPSSDTHTGHEATHFEPPSLPADMTPEQWFGAICEQSLMRQFEKELSECTEAVDCSDAHYQKLSEILGFTVGRKT